MLTWSSSARTHQHINTRSEDFGQKALGLASRYLSGRKSYDIEWRMEITICQPELFVALEQSVCVKLRRDHRDIDIAPLVGMAGSVRAKQNHALDGDSPGFEGSDVASDEGCNLALRLSYASNSFVCVR